MYRSKLLITLEFFSREELHLLDKFLQSPYFFTEKERKEIYPLFQYILRYEGDWTHPRLQKDKINAHLFPKQEIIKGKLEKLMSALLKQIHYFISVHFREKKGDSIRHMITMVNFFRQRNAHKFEIFYLEKAKKEQTRSQLQDRDYFYTGFLIGHEEIQRYLILDQRFDSVDFNKVLQPLDVYYLLNKLDYACFLLSLDYFRQPVDITEIVNFLDEVKPIYTRRNLLKIPLVAVYYQAFDMLKQKGKDETSYWKLKTLIEQNEQLIPPEPLKVLKGLMRGFIILRYNHGATHLLEELFSLHKTHLELGYLNFENGILPSTFKNIITMGLRMKAYDWVFQFLQDYKDKIDVSSNREEVYHYNLACYYFELKKYDKAQELLADQYQDLFYKMAAKRLLLKIYFETRSEVLDAKIDAFKIYVFRLPEKALLERKRASNNNFIDILRQLRNPKTAFNLKRIDKLATKIRNSKFLTEKNWLLEKVEELNRRQTS